MKPVHLPLLLLATILSSCGYEVSLLREASMQGAERGILGGTPDTTSTDTLWVRVRFSSAPGSVFSCTGTAVGRRWVLTAAHCLVLHPSREVANSVEVETGLGTNVFVAATPLPNPSYTNSRSGGVRGDDIALLQLANDLPLTQFARLAAEDEPLPLRIRISGFGRTGPAGQPNNNQGARPSRFSGTFQLAGYEPVSSQDEPGVVGLPMILTRREGSQQACPGDSGAGVFVANPSRTVVGVHSGGRRPFGQPDGCTDMQEWIGFGTDVSLHRPWICQLSGNAVNGCLGSARLAYNQIESYVRRNLWRFGPDASGGNANWYFDNDGNGTFETVQAVFGVLVDAPVIGDFDNNGLADFGTFRIPIAGVNPNFMFYLDANSVLGWQGTDQAIPFGAGSDIPFVGRWNPGQRATPAVYRGGTWFVDSNGQWGYQGNDRSFLFGTNTDVPFVGDWLGTGRDWAGVARTANGSTTVFLDTNGTEGYQSSDYTLPLGMGLSPALAVFVGDFDRDGRANLGVLETPAHPSQPHRLILDTNRLPGIQVFPTEAGNTSIPADTMIPVNLGVQVNGQWRSGRLLFGRRI